MADNFQITAGAGILVAAEDLSGVGSGPYFERIKLWESSVASNRALSKARDTVAGATDDGLLFLGIRNETLVTRASAEGRYGPISIDSFGRLLVAPVTISGAGLALDTTVGGMSTNLGSSTDPEQTGNGSLIAVTKRLRTLLGGGLPAALIGGRLPVDASISVIAGTQFAEDSGHVSGALGTLMLAVRNDAGTSLVDTTLDYAPFQVDSTGALRVVTSGGGGGTSSSFGAALPATGTAAGFSDGTNMQAPRVYDTDSGAGTQYTAGVVLRKSAAAGSVEAATATDPLRIDPTGTTTQPISAASLPLPTSAATDRATAAAPGSVRLSDGAAFYDATKTGQLPTALVGARLDVNIGAAPATLTVAQATAANLKAQVQGEAASGAAKAGNPVQVGAVFTTAQPTVTTGQAVEAQATARGAIIVAPGVDNIAANAWFARVTDGTNTGAVKAASTAAVATDPSQVVSLSPNNGLPTGANLVGRVNPEPQTANGLLIGKLISLASTNAVSLKASAGQVYALFATNTNVAVRYLKLYNKASAPVVGTDVPVMTLAIPGNTAGAGFVLDTGGMGVAFATGIAYATTTGVADADASAVAANEILATILYK